MSRILGLQKLNSTDTSDPNSEPNSTSSWGGCACSTNSATSCRLQEEFVAV